jgi:hypothetical protein
MRASVTWGVRLIDTGRDGALAVYVGGIEVAHVVRDEHHGWDWSYTLDGDAPQLDDDALDALVDAIHDALGTTAEQRVNSGLRNGDASAPRFDHHVPCEGRRDECEAMPTARLGRVHLCRDCAGPELGAES